MIPEHPQPETPLLDACRVIGRALQMEIRAPRQSALPRQAQDSLEAIAQASRLRVRRVALRAKWWEQDNGPLLAYTATDKRPLALLPNGARRYHAHDPVAGTHPPQTVTAEFAASLDPFAYTFYRSFPERAIRLREMLRFGLYSSPRDLLFLVLAGLALGLLGLAPALATGVLFDAVIPSANQFRLLQLALGLAVVAFSGALFQLARDLALLRVESRWGVSLQAALWDRILKLPASFFTHYSAGDIATRVMSLDALRQTLTGVILSTVLNGVFSLFNLGLLLIYDWRLGLLAFAWALVAALVIGLIGRRALYFNQHFHLAHTRLAGFVLQLISGIVRLRVAGAEARAFAVWNERFTQQRRWAYQTRIIGNGLAVFNAAFPTLALISFFAVIAASQAKPSTGTVLAILAAFGGLLAALSSLSSNALIVIRVIPLLETIRPIIATSPEVQPEKIHPGQLNGALEVRNITFRYQADGPIILESVSLDAKPGELVALVGPSGSGKSTLLRLLLGFETPTSGAIYYDGQDLAALDLSVVRRQIGVVLQNSTLMPGDIFSNIVGASSLSLQAAWEAARRAGLEADIRQMPMGMHTVISEGGKTFSAGQRQRLMIARAIVNRPRLLFLDEATSALDNPTQASIVEGLQTLQATRIVIAHRLSTVMRADRLYVFERGQIAQRGTYAELAEQAGPFRELIRRQRV